MLIAGGALLLVAFSSAPLPPPSSSTPPPPAPPLHRLCRSLCLMPQTYLEWNLVNPAPLSGILSLSPTSSCSISDIKMTRSADWAV